MLDTCLANYLYSQEHCPRVQRQEVPKTGRGASSTHSKLGFFAQSWIEEHGLGPKSSWSRLRFFNSILPSLSAGCLTDPRWKPGLSFRPSGDPTAEPRARSRPPAPPYFPLDCSESARAPPRAKRALASSPHPRAHPGLGEPQPMVNAHGPRRRG